MFWASLGFSSSMQLESALGAPAFSESREECYRSGNTLNRVNIFTRQKTRF